MYARNVRLYYIRLGSTPTFLYFNLYLYTLPTQHTTFIFISRFVQVKTAYAGHYVYFNLWKTMRAKHLEYINVILMYAIEWRGCKKRFATYSGESSIWTVHMNSVLSGLKHETIAESFRPNKTRAASVLNGFKNEPFSEFLGEVILKINLVWDVKSSEKFIKNSERVFIRYKDTH